jgi:hypothetical protein
MKEDGFKQLKRPNPPKFDFVANHFFGRFLCNKYIGYGTKSPI